MLPQSFVWTKMGAESGEALAAIIRRKEYERQLGDGMFAWGIGNALGSAVTTLAAEVAEPMVVFSVMPSKPKKEDSQPTSVLLWTAYEDAQGAAHPLPAHMVVTSRGQAGGNDKERHYALFCRASAPLLDTQSHIESVVPAALRNFSTRNPLGSSQVTAVVRHMGNAPPGSRGYPVAFTAELNGALYARLLAPRVLSAIDVADMAAATNGGLNAWDRFVQWIRRPIDQIDFEVLERVRGTSPAELGSLPSKLAINASEIIGRMSCPEHQANRKSVEPGEALPCSAISTDSPRTDHGDEVGGNQETVTEVGRRPSITFYRANEKPYGAFSNLYRREIIIAGQTFPTVEHAYQSLKPRDSRVRDWLLAAPAPSLVALTAHVLTSEEPDPTVIMGRTADSLLGFHTRPGWSRMRYPWMMECLRAKFSQHADLCDLLLATDDSLIVEAGKIDDDAGRRWGIVNGRGQNYLGRMLMRLRAKLCDGDFRDDDLDARLDAGQEPLRVALGVSQ